MKRSFVAVLVFSTFACSQASLAPTPEAPHVVRQMAYSINVPSFAIQSALSAQNGGTVRIPPLDAQQRWDYAAAYGGTPNVYLGEQATPCQNFLGTSVVIAPRGVAGLPTFTSLDWPGAHLDAGVTYEWIGQFVFTRVAALGEFTLRPECAF